MRTAFRRYPVTLAAGLLLLILARSAAAMPLSEVVESVLRHHPDIDSSRALLVASEERISQARSNYYPVLGVEVLASDENDRQYGLPLNRTIRRSDAYLRWNLFHGMADRRTVASAERDHDAAAADLAEAHEQVALQVTRAYLEVLRLRMMEIMGEGYVGEHTRLNEDIRARAELGRISEADVEYAKASLIQAEMEQSKLRGELRGAEQFYRQLTGLKPGSLNQPALDRAVPSLTLDQLLDAVLTGNRKVRALQERAMARDEDIGVAAGALYPTLDLEVRHMLHSDIEPQPLTQTYDSTQLQLRYQLPLGGGNYSRKREAVARQEAAKGAVDSQLLQVRSDLARLWTSWREARAIAPRLEQRTDATFKVVDAYDLQFSAARRTLTDLIAARNERYRARADQLNNRIEQQLTSAELLALLGQLRESLQRPDVSGEPIMR